MNRKNESGFSLAELLVIVGLIFFAVIVIGFTGIPLEYSTGTRTGVPTKISRKGIICKTDEGQMNLGAMAGTNSQGAVVPTVWNFTVTDQQVLEKINTAAERGERVTLHYWQPLVRARCETGSGYFVTAVTY